MPNPLWKDAGKRKNAQQIITWLLQEKSGPGFQVTATIMFALHELAYSSDQELTDTEVSAVLDRMYETRREKIEDFEEILSPVQEAALPVSALSSESGGRLNRAAAEGREDAAEAL